MGVDKDAISEAYEDVRNDGSQTNWCLMAYDEKNIVLSEKGTEYKDLLELLQEDLRQYAYVRLETGDEMSKRAKFVFISWIGQNVGALKKAKVSTDKSFVKEVVKNFALEILADELSDLEYDKVLAQCKKAGGANYGTGK